MLGPQHTAFLTTSGLITVLAVEGTHLGLASRVVVPVAASVEAAVVVVAVAAVEAASVTAVAVDGAALAVAVVVAAAAVVPLTPSSRLRPVGDVEGLLLAVSSEADGVDVASFLFIAEDGCVGRQGLGRLCRGG